MSYNVSDKITSIINLVDQENGITTQIKTFNYVDDKADGEKLKRHLKTLAPFFNEIIINQNAEEDSEEISIPKNLIPSGFE